MFYIHYESGCSIAGLRLGKQLKIPTVQVMHGREDVGEANLIPFGFRTIVATLLNWFHSWYLPHPVKVKRDNYLANTVAATKMWTLMVNHANSADLVLTPSSHFRKKLIHYGVKKEVKVFANGYPDAAFPKNPAVKTFEKGETLKMIWHSRVSGEKRIMVFLQALERVTGKYRLDVYGNGSDLKKAQFFAKKHHLNVVFHGNVPFEKLQNGIENSHLDVLVSYNFDTFGMTLIEAEAYGVPVLFCDPDMREVVPEGSYIQSADESSEKIADAINELFSHPEKIIQMSKIMLAHRDEILISKRIQILENYFQAIINK